MNNLGLCNVICAMLWKMGHKEESLDGYFKIIRCLKNSRVKEKFHFRSFGVLIANVSDELERIGNLEEATYWTKEAINYTLKNGKGTNVERFLGTLLCIKQKQGKSQQICLEIADEALVCSELFKQEHFYCAIKKYIYDNFKKL